MRVRIRRFGKRQVPFGPLALVGCLCRELLGPLVEPQRLHHLRSTSSTPIQGSRPSMLVTRTFNPRHVHRSALPGYCSRPSGTMASADSCSLSPTSRLGLPSQTARQQVSPGKNADLPCTLAPFTTLALDRIGLCCLLPTRPTGMASYEVRVPQVAGLPPASSRPRLTATPLPLANGWCNQPP
jgi:hypothetical protein